jgi:molybdate transport system substrate-binding protein
VKRVFAPGLIAVVLAVWLASACTVAAPPAPTPAPVPAPTSVDPISGDIVVFAASSLTDAFKDIAQDFDRTHPAARVVLSFGGSSQLAVQLENGARADVFASADQAQMDAASRANVIPGPVRTFVQNRLVVIAPRENPAGVSSFQDLGRDGLKVIGAQINVPIGAYTQTLLESASAAPGYGSDFSRRVERNIVSREDTVRQIVAKIQLGEGDAAVVYLTDVTPQIADQFVKIALPDALQVIANYPIAPARGRNPTGGQAFIDYVLADAGQHSLAQWGFLTLPPTSPEGS